MNDQEKQKVAQVLKDAAAGMRQLQAERDAAITMAASHQEKLATIERRLMAEKVAAEMHRKGLRTDENFSDLADDLEKAAAEGKLATIQEAVDMVAPDMGIKTASINHDTAQAGSGSSELEAFLVGQVG
jgi:hypothetical protein